MSDPLKVPKTATAMREAGIPVSDIETVLWSNPRDFFAQSARFDPGELDEPTAFDQAQLFEGNSVLRGQTPTASK